jgi:hypothetical protein
MRGRRDEVAQAKAACRRACGRAKAASGLATAIAEGMLRQNMR